MFAAEEQKVTVTVNAINGNTHTFKAIQLLTGTQDLTSDDMPLGDIAIGKDVSAAELISALNTVEGIQLADTANAAAIAKAISDNANKANDIARALNASVGTKNGTPVNSSTQLDKGYYLIVDTTANLAEDDAYNASLLQLTKDITITQKTDKPSSEKKVKENVKTVTGEKSAVTGQDYPAQYNDVADYNIGDYVPFQLSTKVPDMTYFKNYHITFTDTMDKGLTYATDDNHKLVVKVGGNVISADKYTLTDSGTNGETFTLKIDLKTNGTDIYTKDSVITVDFYGQLNSNAVVGLPGNVNTSTMKYSNNPNQDNGSDEGETPEDKVIVFTYELDNTKVDAETTTTKLKNAEFVLYRLNGNTKEFATFANGKVTGWVTIADPTTSDKIETYYTTKGASKFTSNNDGAFNLVGLDDNTYYLLETKAPTGYNLPTEPFVAVLKATTVNNQNWDMTPENALTQLELNGVVQNTTNRGVAQQNITNTKGAVLPSTGGMGTTIFYIIGVVLLAGAAIILVTKRRMNAE